MIKIKKSKMEGFIVYDESDFRHHAHTNTIGAASVVKENIDHNRMPRSRSYWMLMAHFRVAKKKAYKLKILELINKFCSEEHLQM